MSGVAGWVRAFPVPDGRIWLNGYQFANWLEVEGGGVVIGSTDPVFLSRTHAGTSVLQTFFRGDGAPAVADWKTFQTGFLADSEEDFLQFERARSRGAALDFFLGDLVCDTFPGAVAGGSYRLLRTPALGVVPGLDPEDYPHRIDLDGIETPGAATIDGRTVTATAGGELAIAYAPLYQVVLLGVQRSLTEMNQLIVSVTATEVVP